VTSDGPIVAYRDRSATEIRDISISRYVNGQWSEPAVMHRDNWQINACPVNGPALSASGRRVAIAWFSAKGEQGHAYAAFSTDAGASFGTPIALDDFSALGRVDVALLDDGSAMATWIEFQEGRAQFKMRRRSGNELVFAWTESSQPTRVMTAVAGIAGRSTAR
jgi:hypothetical protein